MDGIFRLMLSEEWELSAKQIERVCLERKRARESSATSVTLEAPSRLRATHRHCRTTERKTGCSRKTGPAFCTTDKRSCRDKSLDRSSWDLKRGVLLVEYFKKEYTGLQKHTSDLECRREEVSWLADKVNEIQDKRLFVKRARNYWTFQSVLSLHHWNWCHQ